MLKKQFHLFRVLLLALAAMMICPAARAQTVEEAVFFMLFGFDSEERVSEPLSQVQVHRLSLNRWSVDSASLAGKFKNQIEIVADKDMKCDYQVKVFDEANVLQQVDVFHFLTVTEYKADVISMPGILGAEGPSMGTIDIYGSGLFDHYYKDASGRELLRQENHWHRYGIASTKRSRLEKAYSFFKERAGCQGRAF